MKNKSEAFEGVANGRRMMIIRKDTKDQFPYQFGVLKARLIVEHFEAIKAFAAKDPFINAEVR